MPAGTAGNHDDSFCSTKFFEIVLNACHRNGAIYYIQSSPQTIKQSIWLFKNLFEHEMVIPSFFNSSQLKIQFLYKGRNFFVAQVFQDEFIAFDNCQFVV